MRFKTGMLVSTTTQTVQVRQYDKSGCVGRVVQGDQRGEVVFVARESIIDSVDVLKGASKLARSILTN